MAASLLTALPVIVLYMLGQRFMIAGLTAGSVKADGSTRRINKTVELLAQGQPIYYTGAEDRGLRRWSCREHRPGPTTSTIDMEHDPFDVAELHEFMRGLVDGGPTASGHRTPAVIVTLPTNGSDLQTSSAPTSGWSARCWPPASTASCCATPSRRRRSKRSSNRRATRFRRSVAMAAAGEGRRGSGGQAQAASIWGLETAEYLQRADPWPLNPDGELLLGLKIENTRALANADAVAAVPGIAFAEWGPGDMGMSLGHGRCARSAVPARDAGRARQSARRVQSQQASAFLEQVTPENVVEQIDRRRHGRRRHTSRSRRRDRPPAHTNRPNPGNSVRR